MNNAEVLDILALAHALLDAGWCQQGRAQDAAGLGVDTENAEAVRFCVIGALYAATFELHERDPYTEVELLVDLVRRAPRRPIGITAYNDAPQRRKRDVLRLLERAAARVGK